VNGARRSRHPSNALRTPAGDCLFLLTRGVVAVYADRAVPHLHPFRSPETTAHPAHGTAVAISLGSLRTAPGLRRGEEEPGCRSSHSVGRSATHLMLSPRQVALPRRPARVSELASTTNTRFGYRPPLMGAGTALACAVMCPRRQTLRECAHVISHGSPCGGRASRSPCSAQILVRRRGPEFVLPS